MVVSKLDNKVVKGENGKGNEGESNDGEGDAKAVLDILKEQRQLREALENELKNMVYLVPGKQH